MTKTIDKVIARHNKIALYFSGGKDSTVLLDIMEPWLDKIMVVWINTGDAPKDVIELMAATKKRVPHFTEVLGNQPGVISRYGIPVDLIPPEAMRPYNEYIHPDTVKLQSRYDCCYKSAWEPLQRYVEVNRYTLLIRGQRKGEQLRNHMDDSVVGTMEMFNPLLDWTEKEIFDYISEHQLTLLPHYKFATSSIDCCTCTAYLTEMKDKITYLKAYESDKIPAYLDRLALIASTLYPHINSFIKTTDKAFTDE